MTDGDPLSVSLAKQNAVSNGCSNRIVSTKLLWYVDLDKVISIQFTTPPYVIVEQG
jgi:hypothetical protein